MITVKLLDDPDDDKNVYLIEVKGPAILTPALQREGYERHELALGKYVVNDDEVLRDELLLLNNLATPLSCVADMLVAELYQGAERIKSGENALSVLDDLIRTVRFNNVEVIK